MTLNLCVRFLADGVPRTLWLAPRTGPGIVVDPTEPDLAHALEIARAAGGTGIRLEYVEQGVPVRPAFVVHIPARGGD